MTIAEQLNVYASFAGSYLTSIVYLNILIITVNSALIYRLGLSFNPTRRGVKRRNSPKIKSSSWFDWIICSISRLYNYIKCNPFIAFSGIAIILCVLCIFIIIGSYRDIIDIIMQANEVGNRIRLKSPFSCFGYLFWLDIASLASSLFSIIYCLKYTYEHDHAD